jgi:1-acyl-sn-glycerol-3-phosphate acyltransferase
MMGADCILAPRMIRSLLTLVFLPLWTIVIGIPAVLAGLLPRGDEKILAIGRVWARGILAVAGIRVDVRGQEHVIPGRTCIFLANHQSNLDPLAVLVATPVPFRVVAKRFLFWIPVFGQVIWLLGVIPIDRARRGRAIRSMERAAARVREGMPIYFFPEGTRSPDERLLPFKKGAFVVAVQAGVPVIPVTIAGSGPLWPRHSPFLRSGRITLTFGEPLSTEGYTFATKERLMQAVRRRMLDGLGQEESFPGSPGAVPGARAAASSASAAS